MTKTIEEYRPAIHKVWIKKGLLTKRESDRITQDFLDKQEFKAQVNEENTEQDIMEALSEMEKNDPSEDYKRS